MFKRFRITYRRHFFHNCGIFVDEIGDVPVVAEKFVSEWICRFGAGLILWFSVIFDWIFSAILLNVVRKLHNTQILPIKCGIVIFVRKRITESFYVYSEKSIVKSLGDRNYSHKFYSLSSFGSMSELCLTQHCFT